VLVALFVQFTFEFFSVLDQLFCELIQTRALQVLGGLVNQFNTMHGFVWLRCVVLWIMVVFDVVQEIGSLLLKLSAFFTPPAFQKFSSFLPQAFDFFATLPLQAFDLVARCIVCL